MKNTAATLIVAFSLVACSSETSPAAQNVQAGCATRSYAEIGGPFELVDHRGEAVTQAAYSDKDALVYFGFTYCPDVCPFTLYGVGRALEQLPDGVEPPRTLLVSVDPERDTPEAMAAYIKSSGFPEDIAGLTGEDEAIKAMATSFAASYSRIEDPDSTAGYTMDHTSILYLMDKDWKLKTFFTHDATPDAIASCLIELSG
ncbi:MAG: SCO family protein [Pseudomonadota bacterium]